MAAVPKTPAEWLPILTKRLDERHPAFDRPRRYATGWADLPEMGKNLRASWQAFQRKARTDYGGAAVRSLVTRIRPAGFRIGTSDDHPGLAVLRQIELDCRLHTQIRDAIRDYVEVSVGYLVAGTTDDGTVIVRREKPEQFYAEPDPVRPWKARASVKVWRDRIEGVDYADVRTPEASQRFVRPSQTDGGSDIRGASGTTWKPLSDEPVERRALGVGVAILEGGDAAGFLTPHFDVIDRINLGKLNRLVVAAMQAFRQRALKPTKDDRGAGGLPDIDEDGNTIDWAKAFEPAPGALWELPEGVDIWESQQTDWRAMLDAETQDARDFAAVTGTPISVLIPEGQNQSAEGAANAKEQQVTLARDTIDRLKPAIAVAIVYALRLAGVPLDDPTEDTVEVLFAPPEHVSLTERYAAAVQAKGAGLAPRTIKRDVLGMTPDQIKQDEADASAELLLAAAFGDVMGRASGGTDSGTARPSDVGTERVQDGRP